MNACMHATYSSCIQNAKSGDYLLRFGALFLRKMEQVLVFLYTSFMNVRSGVIQIVFGWMMSRHCYPGGLVH